MRRVLFFMMMWLWFVALAHAGNAVLEWNEAVLAALKRDATAPLLVARSLAIVHLAMQDAAGKKGDETAMAEAAFAVAIVLLPSHRAEFEKLRERRVTSASAVARGEAAAQRILEERANDGSSMQVSYIPKNEPGQWRRTPPFLRPPELPQWAGKVKPFVLKSAEQFRPAGPPALDSAAWAKAVSEVKALGGKKSDERTPDDMTIAHFWSDFSNTETPPGHWNSIARTIAAERKLSAAECARLFATLNIALTDAGIACWEAKYHFNFWRPVTAISRDGTEWEPLLTTPAHPEYPSGHSVFSGAAAAVLARHFGTDKIAFSVRSDALPGATRRFTSLRACAEECGASRVIGGIHFRFSCVDGLKLGEQVGGGVLAREKR